MFDDYVIDFALDRMRDGERVAVVTLVKIEGSSPRHLGAQMAVSESGPPKCFTKIRSAVKANDKIKGDPYDDQRAS